MHGTMRQEKKIECDYDNPQTAAVFTPTGTYNYGRSSQNIMVDGLSDQFVLQGTPTTPHYAYSVSLKSRAAIATANKAGKALWFDRQSGQFTSSKAYFDKIPQWLKDFNAIHAVSSPSIVQWKQMYDDTSKAYAFSNINDYRFVRKELPLINTSIPINTKVNNKNPYALFELTPQANKLVLDLAQECVKQIMLKQKNNRLLLWVCISSLDKLGHQYGPWSKESIDMIYHLDKEIGDFMQVAENSVGKDNVLFVLTSDHGISPIIEHIHEKGLTLGHRIDATSLIHKINTSVEKKYNVKNIVHAIKGHQFYLDTNKLQAFPSAEQNNIIQDIRATIEAQPGIKRAWTPQDLYNNHFPTHSVEHFFKQQIFPPRSGDLIIQVFPYTIISQHQKGTSHKTPHTYNTHVPIVFYRNAYTQKKNVHNRVLTLQLANTLAALLEIPQPSSSLQDVLPGVLPK